MYTTIFLDFNTLASRVYQGMKAKGV